MAPASKSKKKAPRRGKGAKTLNKVQRKQVLKIVKGAAETKRVAFYQTYNDGSSSLRSGGLWANRGWAIQNNSITVNSVDIHQLIPFLSQGMDDWNRIGQRVSPVALNVRGSVRISLPQIIKQVPIDLKVYVYVLQHVTIKSYDNLYNNNDFRQFLEVGDGTTVPFTGIPPNKAMPVSKQYYKVLSRKVITLRYAGLYLNPNGGDGLIPVGSTVSVANSHTWYADFSMNLTKHLPKTLMYPETTLATPNPDIEDTPTNTAPFMSFGFIDWFNPSDQTVDATFPRLEQTYVSELLFKDL